MMTKNNVTRQPTTTILSLILGGISAISPIISLASQPENVAPEQPRWFEIEVILYKLTSDQGLLNESWATDTKMVLPNELVDFLQPLRDPSLLASNPPDVNNQTNGSSDINKNNFDPEIVDPEIIAQTIEQPFVLLDEELLQLKTEALNISRHADYSLLAHFSWRQPVLSQSKSTNIRIAGGYDYHQSFEYSGEKILNLSTPENLIADGDNLPSKERAINKGNHKDKTKQTAQIGSQEKLTEDEISESPQVALPWVPEIDGSILVYIHRNYLHVDTDLYYRRPDREEVDFFDMLNQLPPLDLEDNIAAPEVNLLENNQPSIEENDFAWQYDRDFLSDETEKTYTERLFNYPLKQKRRLKSNQLNYYDHPLIGMLVIIRPYEIAPESEQFQSTELTTTYK